MTGMKSLESTVTKLSSVLEIERKVTWVKFIFDKGEYEASDARTLTNKCPYCVMVKSAMAGVSIKASLEQFGCGGAINALGMTISDELSKSGRSALNLGIYKDIGVDYDKFYYYDYVKK